MLLQLRSPKANETETKPPHCGVSSIITSELEFHSHSIPASEKDHLNMVLRGRVAGSFTFYSQLFARYTFTVGWTGRGGNKRCPNLGPTLP